MASNKTDRLKRWRKIIAVERSMIDSPNNLKSEDSLSCENYGNSEHQSVSGNCHSSGSYLLINRFSCLQWG